jgi:hypothetical protein
MVSGVISIIIGVIFGGNSFLISPSSAPQQTVQYLGFVCAAIFIVGGLILIRLGGFNGDIEERLKKQDEIIEVLAKGTKELIKEIRAINVILQSGMDQNKGQNPEHKIDINA